VKNTIGSLIGFAIESLERRMELEESTFLTLDCPTKLQSLRQCGTGTKTDLQTNGIRYKAQR